MRLLLTVANRLAIDLAHIWLEPYGCAFFVPIRSPTLIDVRRETRGDEKGKWGKKMCGFHAV